MIEIRDTTIRGDQIAAVAGPRKHDSLGKFKLFITLVGGKELEFLFASEHDAKVAHAALINAMKGG